MSSALIVNDNKTITDRTAVMLEDLGYDVYVVNSESLVSHSCLTLRPSLAVVDIEMHGGAGFESISAVRRADQDILVMAVTRGGHRDLWPKVARVCGASQYLVGPVSSPKLAAALAVKGDRALVQPGLGGETCLPTGI